MTDATAASPAEGPANLDPAKVAAECEATVPWANIGAIYGPIGAMGLGAGMLLADLIQPRYLPDQKAYGTARGPALILSHECDIDPDNVRPFNDNVLVAPIIQLDRYLDVAAAAYDPAEVRSFLLHVASGHVSRMIFLPRFGGSGNPLYFGGLIDFNAITSAGIQPVAEATQLCALSGYGLQIIDFALQEHLGRPKVDPSPQPS